MLRQIFTGVFLVVLGVSVRATDGTWTNSGVITFPPQVDATNFLNTGTIAITTTVPFDTSNTQNFTNSGTMQGSIGFRFDHAARNSAGGQIAPRKHAANFHNRLGGTIQAFDGPLPSGFSGSYLYVHATNIINQGTLSVGVGGLLELNGTNVDLTRSGVGVNPIIPQGSFNQVPDTNSFVPDVVIRDLYWGQTNAAFPTSGIINSFGPIFIAISPVHRVQNNGGTGLTQIGVFDPFHDAYTNVVDGLTRSLTNDVGDVTEEFFATNIIRQAVFVGTSDPATFAASINFSPSSSPTNLMRTVAIELATVSTNAITAAAETTTIYFVDTLASENDRGLLVNFNDGTSRPANYLVSRAPVPEFFSGGPGNAFVTENFLYDGNFTNNVVTGDYAGYAADVDDLLSRPPLIPEGTVSNLPGRVQIVADSLDMNRTRVRGAGLVSVRANHLISSSNAVVDAENLTFTLGAPESGDLKVQSLMKQSVARVRGQMFAWSAVWTNSYTELITNNYTLDTNDNVYVVSPLTNTVNMRLYALIVDATPLLNVLPVTVHEMHARGSNVVFRDAATIAQSFIVDAENFTLEGAILFSNALQSWTFTNAPNLRNFTNTGSLVIPSEAHFGDDGPEPYLSFVNRGLIQANGQNINSDYCELSGTNFTDGAMIVVTRSGKFENGRIATGGDVSLQGDIIKINRSLISAGGRLSLAVTGSLSDNGGTSSNTISFRDGVYLPFKPATGDLLGSSVNSIAPIFAAVTHTWAGEDRGVSGAGYFNNMALGRLTLTPEGVDPLFIFTGSGANNALYVDLLDLSQLSDYTSYLQIDPNIVIYYAAANLNFTPPGLQSPEEFLDGQFGNRLRWVRDFAGPNSSVDVVINGNQTVRVNRALRNSRIIDSDGDGVPNFFDLSPFDGVSLNAVQLAQSPSGIMISWEAAAGMTYHVEVKTNQNAPWQHFATTKFNAATNGICSVLDTNKPVGNGIRLYRVRYNPVSH